MVPQSRPSGVPAALARRAEDDSVTFGCSAAVLLSACEASLLLVVKRRRAESEREAIMLG